MDLERQTLSYLERQAQTYFEETTPQLRQIARNHRISVAALTIVEVLGVRKAYDPESGLTIAEIDEAQRGTFSRDNLKISIRTLTEGGYVKKEKKEKSPRKPGRDPYSPHLTKTGRKLYEEILYCFVTSEKQDKNPKHKNPLSFKQTCH